jgi:hypothetical protein
LIRPEGKRRGEQKKKIWPKESRNSSKFFFGRKSLETPSIFFRPILFLGFWDHFELYAIIVKFFWHLHAFQSSFMQFSEISKKILEPIQIFHLAGRFETLSILVIFASSGRYSEHCCLLLFGVAA